MTIEILPGTEADIARCARMQRTAFSIHPETKKVNETLFPGSSTGGGDSAASEAAATKALGDVLRRDPVNTRFIKAVDTSLSGEDAVVGWAKWHIYTNGFPGAPARKWEPAGCNVEACQLFFGGIDELQNKLMRGKPCVCLQPVMVAAEHQRRGIGTKLINWGLELAQELNQPAFLIASPIGHELYRRCGFQDVEELVADLSKYGLDEPHSTWAMLWEPKANTA